MKELLDSLIEILASLCFEINNRSDACTFEKEVNVKRKDNAMILLDFT